MKEPGNNLVRNFALFSVVIILSLGLILDYTISTKIEDLMIERAKTTIVQHAQQRVNFHLEPEHFSDPDYLKNRDIFEEYYNDVRTNEIVRIKVFDKNGTIIFSDDEGLVGRNFDDNMELYEGLKGHVEVEIVRKLVKKEHIFDRNIYKEAMEIYIPLWFDNPDEIVGVVELYQNLEIIDAEIKEIQKTVSFLIFISMGILYFSLLWIVKGASDTIIKKNEELRDSYEELKELDKAKNEFMHTMSHELRTPMNAIMGFSDLLKQQTMGDLGEKHERYLDNIINSGEHLLNLINDILDLNKIECSEIELDIKNIHLNNAINDSLEMIKEEAAKKNVKIRTQFDPGIDYINVDKQKFRQVLFNLLVNAVKFSKDEGGTVTVMTEKMNDMVKISVRDTGIGIEDEFKKKLFKKFTQGDSSETRRYGGTGLGLAISKKLVEMLGGTIIVESKYGEGSTFSIFLPIEGKKVV